jgi:septal ring factor EnvC (AmiA/AmiB activator)
MRRASRGSHEPPVSLFAFQDVMTSVMAIILMTALLLALERSGATALPASTSSFETAELLARRAAAAAAMERIREDTVGRSDRPLERITKGRLALDALYRQVEQAEGELAQAYDNLKQTVTDEAVHRQIDDLAQTESQLGEKKGQLRELQLSRRLTYIAGEEYERRPVLVELSAAGWRVAIAHNADHGITMTQADRSERMVTLRGVLAQAHPSSHYVLLIVKPSGLPDYSACTEALAKQGYRMGIDALPEDWTSIIGDPSPSPGGER